MGMMKHEHHEEIATLEPDYNHAQEEHNDSQRREHESRSRDED